MYHLYDIKAKDKNDNYLYACIEKQNANTIKTFFTTNKKEIREKDCYKYKKITCNDVNNKKYDCSKVDAKGLFSTQSFSYFTYKIGEKEYIKDFLTDKFVVDPKEYDSYKWENGIIVLYIGDKQKIYESDANAYFTYSDSDEYKIIDSFIYNGKKYGVVLQNPAGNIKVYIDGTTYLNDVKVDKVLYIWDKKRIFIVDENHIKLYEYNNLIWDYGEFSDINNIKFVTSTGNIEGNITSYAFLNEKTQQPVYLEYDTNTKIGTIRYSNHN